MKVARTVREQVHDREVVSRVSSLMIGAPDMAFGRYFVFLYLLVIVNQTSYWYGRSSLNLGFIEKIKLNTACLEKADDLVVYTDVVLLELIYVKLKLYYLNFNSLVPLMSGFILEILGYIILMLVTERLTGIPVK